MLGETPVREGEVGVDQVAHAAVLVDQGGEEELGLPRHRLPELVVVLGVEARVGGGRAELVEPECLPREVADEALRPLVVEQAVHLCGEHGRVRQPPVARRAEQRGVRQAAPEEVRQARREREVVERARIAARRRVRIVARRRARIVARRIVAARFGGAPLEEERGGAEDGA